MKKRRSLLGGRRSKGSFDALLLPHVEALLRIAHRLCDTPADAEDLVQSLIVKLYRGRRKLADVEGLRPWLLQGLYRLYIDEQRRQTRRAALSMDQPAAAAAGGALGETLSDPGPQPQEQYEYDLRTECLQRAVRQLEEHHRILLVLHDIEGYTLSELQQSLSLPLGTLKSRLHRARAALRSRLRSLEPFSDIERFRW